MNKQEIDQICAIYASLLEINFAIWKHCSEPTYEESFDVIANYVEIICAHIPEELREQVLEKWIAEKPAHEYKEYHDFNAERYEL